MAQKPDNKQSRLAKLRSMGIDYAQGFLLHRPAPLNDLLSSNVVACA